TAQVPAAAAELVRRRVDILLASGTPSVLPARDAVGQILVVFVATFDPVATGLVASLARPGGNISGMTKKAVMRADNDGEGGILALMSLLGIKHGERAGVIVLGLLGAALLYGDGAITPAISVLSALEGIKTPVPAFAPYVLPLSIFVLIALFCLQPQGTAR